MAAKRLTFDSNESLEGLQENANPKCQEEHAIEEGAEQLCSLPTKREVLPCFFLLGNLSDGQLLWEQPRMRMT